MSADLFATPFELQELFKLENPAVAESEGDRKLGKKPALDDEEEEKLSDLIDNYDIIIIVY